MQTVIGQNAFLPKDDDIGQYETPPTADERAEMLGFLDGSTWLWPHVYHLAALCQERGGQLEVARWFHQTAAGGGHAGSQLAVDTGDDRDTGGARHAPGGRVDTAELLERLCHGRPLMVGCALWAIGLLRLQGVGGASPDPKRARQAFLCASVMGDPEAMDEVDATTPEVVDLAPEDSDSD